MNESDWRVVFYREPNGRSPVREFFESVDMRVQESLLASVELLRSRNVQARMPLARHLDGKLWELRDEVRTNIYRVIYFFYSGKRIVLVHAFQKKSQKTPSQDIAIARERHERFLRQEGAMNT